MMKIQVFDENRKVREKVEPKQFSFHTEIGGQVPSEYKMPKEAVIYIEGFELMLTNYLNEVSVDIFNDGTLFDTDINCIMDRTLASYEEQHLMQLREIEDIGNAIDKEIFNLQKKCEMLYDKVNDKAQIKLIQEEKQDDEEKKIKYQKAAA